MSDSKAEQQVWIRDSATLLQRVWNRLDQLEAENAEMRREFAKFPGRVDQGFVVVADRFL